MRFGRNWKSGKTSEDHDLPTYRDLLWLTVTFPHLVNHTSQLRHRLGGQPRSLSWRTLQYAHWTSFSPPFLSGRLLQIFIKSNVEISSTTLSNICISAPDASFSFPLPPAHASLARCSNCKEWILLNLKSNQKHPINIPSLYAFKFLKTSQEQRMQGGGTKVSPW